MVRIIDLDSAKHCMGGVVKTKNLFVIEDELDKYHLFGFMLSSAVCAACATDSEPAELLT